MLYSCYLPYSKEADGNQEQLKLVRRLCKNKEECRVDVSREFFGNFECPQTDAGNMELRLAYSCAGEGNDATKINAPVCDGDNDLDKPTPSTGTCDHDDPGEKHQVDVPGCGGSIDIVCDGGCIDVHEVLKP